MQTVILIRHGYLSSWDEKLKARGIPAHERLDAGLADIGKQQARLSAEHLLTSGGVDAVTFHLDIERPSKGPRVVALA